MSVVSREIFTGYWNGILTVQMLFMYIMWYLCDNLCGYLPSQAVCCVVHCYSLLAECTNRLLILLFWSIFQFCVSFSKYTCWKLLSLDINNFNSCILWKIVYIVLKRDYTAIFRINFKVNCISGILLHCIKYRRQTSDIFMCSRDCSNVIG